MDVLTYGLLNKKVEEAKNVSGEKITEAVNTYLDENPPTAGATAEQAAQIDKNVADIGELKSDMEQLSEEMKNQTGSGSGLTTALKLALKTYFTNMQTLLPQLAYVTEENIGTTLISDAQDVVTALESGGNTGTTNYTITRSLVGCTSSSAITSISEGLAHTETLTANEGYTLVGATVKVTMGGSDISSNYVDGILTINSVTGNIVISVSAIEEGISDVGDVNNESLWEQGALGANCSSTDTLYPSSTSRLRMISAIDDDVDRITIDDGYEYIIVCYINSQCSLTYRTYFGYYNPDGSPVSPSINTGTSYLTDTGIWNDSEISMSDVRANIAKVDSANTYYFKVVIRNSVDTSANITKSEGLKIHLLKD